MTNYKNVPVLRFNEFEDEWEVIQLQKLFNFRNGVNASKEQYGQGFKFINVLDIINNDFITYDKIQGSVEISNEIFKKNEVKYGDILFQRSSETREEVGQANVYLDKEKSATFGGFVIRGQGIVDYNPVFINFLLKTSPARKEIVTKSGGSTRFNVGQDILSKVKISLPTVPEQQKIANFLTATDTKIQQLRQKKGLLNDYKKGVMQQIFKQEIRFKNDDGGDFEDWEVKKLGEVGKFIGGGTPSSEIEAYWNGKVPWISSSDIKENVINKIDITRFISENAIKNSATKLIPANSILVISRVGVGKFAINEVPLCTSQDFTNLIVKDSNSYFLAYYFLASANRFKKISQGTSIKGFTMSDMKKMKFQIPQLEEQKKIANFLSSIDERIGKVSVEIGEMERYKKGLLQGMFV
jgi:type I restriction enzyme S subunit